MQSDFNAKMKLLVKSEKALLDLEIRKRSRQALWTALGLVAILVGLVMLNVTAFLYLSGKFSNLEAAAILTGLNLLFAGIFFYIAGKQDRGAEAKSIEDIRDFAWSQVSEDLDDVKGSINDFRQSIVKVKSGVDSFTSGNFFGASKVMPIITALIELNKKR